MPTYEIAGRSNCPQIARCMIYCDRLCHFVPNIETKFHLFSTDTFRKQTYKLIEVFKWNSEGTLQETGPIVYTPEGTFIGDDQCFYALMNAKFGIEYNEPDIPENEIDFEVQRLTMANIRSVFLKEKSSINELCFKKHIDDTWENIFTAFPSTHKLSGICPDIFSKPPQIRDEEDSNDDDEENTNNYISDNSDDDTLSPIEKNKSKRTEDLFKLLFDDNFLPSENCPIQRKTCAFRILDDMIITRPIQKGIRWVLWRSNHYYAQHKTFSKLQFSFENIPSELVIGTRISALSDNNFLQHLMNSPSSRNNVLNVSQQEFVGITGLNTNVESCQESNSEYHLCFHQQPITTKHCILVANDDIKRTSEKLSNVGAMDCFKKTFGIISDSTWEDSLGKIKEILLSMLPTSTFASPNKSKPSQKKRTLSLFVQTQSEMQELAEHISKARAGILIFEKMPAKLAHVRLLHEMDALPSMCLVLGKMERLNGETLEAMETTQIPCIEVDPMDRTPETAAQMISRYIAEAAPPLFKNQHKISRRFQDTHLLTEGEWNASRVVLCSCDGIFGYQGIPAHITDFRRPLDTHLQFYPTPVYPPNEQAFSPLDFPLHHIFSNTTSEKKVTLEVFPFLHSFQTFETTPLFPQIESSHPAAKTLPKLPHGPTVKTLQSAFDRATDHISLQSGGVIDISSVCFTLLFSQTFLLIIPHSAPCETTLPLLTPTILAIWQEAPLPPPISFCGGPIIFPNFQHSWRDPEQDIHSQTDSGNVNITQERLEDDVPSKDEGANESAGCNLKFNEGPIIPNTPIPLVLRPHHSAIVDWKCGVPDARNTGQLIVENNVVYRRFTKPANTGLIRRPEENDLLTKYIYRSGMSGERSGQTNFEEETNEDVSIDESAPVDDGMSTPRSTSTENPSINLDYAIRLDSWEELKDNLMECFQTVQKGSYALSITEDAWEKPVDILSLFCIDFKKIGQ